MIIVNLLFRFVWILNVSNVTDNHFLDFLSFNIGSPNMNLILCTIEMLRRIIWNLFRVE